MIFSINAQFIRHIDHTISKAFKSYHQIKNIMLHKKSLSTNVKIILYKQLIKPILTYSFPIWHSITSAQMERLRLFVRKILRICTQKKRKSRSCHYINNVTLYKIAKIDRFDRYTIESAKNQQQNFEYDFVFGARRALLEYSSASAPAVKRRYRMERCRTKV